MKNRNFSKEFDDVFDEEQVCYNEFNYFGYSSDRLGLAEGIPFRMQIKSFFDEKDLVSFLHTITKRQDVIFGGVEEKYAYDSINQEEVLKYFLKFALIVNED